MHPRLAAYLQRATAVFLVHKYTWIDVASVDTNTIDEEGRPVFEDSEPEYDKPCLFLWEDLQSQPDSGLSTLVRTPTLYVPHDDEINVGDYVQAVVSRDNTTLLLNSQVLSIDSTAE